MHWPLAGTSLSWCTDIRGIPGICECPHDLFLMSTSNENPKETDGDIREMGGIIAREAYVDFPGPRIDTRRITRRE